MLGPCSTKVHSGGCFRGQQDSLQGLYHLSQIVEGVQRKNAEGLTRLGIPDLAAYADIGAMGPSGLGGALTGITAVASGACETAVVFRAITRAAGHTGTSRAGGGEQLGQMGSSMPFTVPYGHFPIIPTIGLMMRRRIDEITFERSTMLLCSPSRRRSMKRYFSRVSSG